MEKRITILFECNGKTTNGTKRHVRHKCFNTFKSPGTREKKNLISHQKSLQKGDVYRDIKPKVIIFNRGFISQQF